MPFILIALGILFLVVAVQGTQGTLFTLLKSEFVGNNSFVVFAAAFVVLGLIAYIKPVRPVAHALMALVFLVLLLTNGKGFFSQFNAALKNPVAPSAASNTSTPSLTAGSPVTLYGGSGTVLPNLTSPSITQAPTTVPLGNEIPQ
jgi:hypothetical protein